MHVLLLHQLIAEGATPDEQDVLVQRDAVSAALARLGHNVSMLACSLDLSAIARGVNERRPDVVFNLVESLGGYDRLIHFVPELLESLGVRYTGFSAEAMLRTTNKVSAKRVLAKLDLPTPHWFYRGSFENECDIDWPSKWICKTIWEHASFGMTDKAVVACEDEEELAHAVSDWEKRLARPVFAEQFIEGREFNVSLLELADGVDVLPIAEIEFVEFPPDQPRIVGYDAKWNESSRAYHHTPRKFLCSDEDVALQENLAELSRECWQAFGLRGYARVDFRVDAHDRPFILEINANPCLSPDAGFAAALEQTGIALDEAVNWILQSALLTGR